MQTQLRLLLAVPIAVGCASSHEAIVEVGEDLSSSATFTNQSIVAETGSFSFAFDAVPQQADENAVVGLANGPAAAYTDLAVLVRFNPSGFIDARSGGAYTANANIPYAGRQTYHFRLAVDIGAHRYDAYVTPPGSSERAIGTGLAFRSEQASVTRLNDLATYAAVGAVEVSTGATSYVAPAGKDSNPGTLAQPFLTIQHAIDAAKSNTTIYVRAGTFGGGFTISNKSGIAVMAYPGEEQKAIVTKGCVSCGLAIKIAGSNGITLSALAITNTEESLQIERSTNVTVRGCKIYHTGNESIAVHDKSSFVQILDNVIQDRGNYQSQYSEGIYVGTGAYPNAWNVPFPDTTNNVILRGNDVSNAGHDSAEGINIKGETHAVTVEHNSIHDMRVYTGGGISIDGPSKDPASGKVYQLPSNANYVIRGNLVHHITTSSKYSDGNGITNKAGGASIYNNVSRDNQHYGVVVNDIAGIKQTSHILNNTLARNTGSSDGGGVYVLGSSVVDIRNNIGSARSSNLAFATGLFVNASGSDFHLVKGSAAIDHGANVGVTTDYDGVARPQGAGYDFGAFEYH